MSKTVIQTVIGAAQFDGTAGMGLVQFETAPGTPDLDSSRRPNLFMVSFFTTSPVGSVQARLSASGAATEVIELVNQTNISSFVWPCAAFNFFVPRAANTFYFQLTVVTVGKTADGTLIVEFEQATLAGGRP